MAVKWVEGFESHVNSAQTARKYASLSGSFTVGAGRVFGNSGTITNTVAITPSLGLDNTWTVGFGVRLNAHSVLLNSGAQGLYLERGANEQVHIEMVSTSGVGFQWRLMRGATQIAISSSYDFGVWHYFELQVTARTGTNGAYELRHNGVLVFSGSSVNLAASGSDGADIFAVRYTAGLTGTLFYDDIYVLDSTGASNTTFLGPSIVEAVEMSATGASNQWANDSGGAQSANWDQVNDSGLVGPDEVGIGGTISSDTNGHLDLYNATDLSQITGNIHAVMVGIQAVMTAAGSRTLRFKYRDPDTTVVNGNSFVVASTVYDEFTQVFNVNPNSGAAWDVNEIDDGQFGVEVVS